jgi:hypothetical protein
MNHHSTQPRGCTTSSRQTSEHPFIRGFLDGTVGLFDILGVRARPLWRRTPEDDARNLQRDFQRIAQDFRTVLSKIGLPAPK